MCFYVHIHIGNSNNNLMTLSLKHIDLIANYFVLPNTVTCIRLLCTPSSNIRNVLIRFFHILTFNACNTCNILFQGLGNLILFTQLTKLENIVLFSRLHV